MVFDRLMVRHWDTHFDGRRSHLFRVPLALSPSASSASLTMG
jgi:hypothetical protein